MTTIVPLADFFAAGTEDDWRKAVAGTRMASGKPAPDSSEPSIDPISLHARRVGARSIAGRPPGRVWSIVQRINTADARSTGSEIAEAIAGGATGVAITFAGTSHALGGRLPIAKAAEVAAALPALPEGFVLHVECGDPIVAESFRRCGAEVVVAFDPIATLAIGSREPIRNEAIRATATAFDATKTTGPVVIADGRLWHAGGATEEQELGVTLATFVSYLRALESQERIGIALVVDTNQFRGIAKLRAMRLLLARIAEVAALTGPSPRIHAETAWRTMSIRDSQMNILRSATAAFGAAIGGADTITVLPFDALAPDSQQHAGRLARNTQIILDEEAHLAHVADAAAGSGVIEALTASFAEAAWKRFQAIEAEGGIAAAIAEGSLLREVAEAREARISRIASAELKMVGVNAYTADALPARFKRLPVGRTPALAFKRLPEPFEAAGA